MLCSIRTDWEPFSWRFGYRELVFVFAGLVPLLIVGLALVGLLAGKAEPDPDHERPRALYLAAASYLALLALLTGAFFVVDGLTRARASSLAGGLITTCIAAGVVTFHQPRLLRTPASGPGARIVTRYLYLACFAAAVTAVVAFGVAAYHVLAAVAPDSFGQSDRGDAVRTVVNGVAMTVMAGLVFARHWSAADDRHAAQKEAVHAE